MSKNETMPSSSSSSETPPKPYSLLFHPYLTWTEKLISFSIGYLLDLGRLSQPEIGSTDSKQMLSEKRKQMRDMEAGSRGKSALNEWSKVMSSSSSTSSSSNNDKDSCCLLAESSGFIPFRKNILQEWNIVDRQDVLPKNAVSAANDREGVKILVRFPSSLLPTELQQDGNILEYSGCLEVEFDKIDLRTFAPDVPMLIFFHGGGLTLGGCHDSILIDEATRLVQNAATTKQRSNDDDDDNNDNNNGRSSSSPPGIITVSVEYGLAPEDPFPIAIMDGLSVIEYLLSEAESNNNIRKAVHITGNSAGANISLVTGLESFRRYPGKILSIQAQSPFLNPAGDTMSYYMNKNVFPDTQWLRWCWEAYLGLENQNQKQTTSDNNDNNNDNETNNHALEKILRKDSNYSSWNKWKADHPSKALHRLVNPVLDMPEGLDDEAIAPKIILRYNIGDPLQDDGEDIVNALKHKKAANASYFKQTGLHCHIGTIYNADALNEFWKIWSEAIFGVVGGDGDGASK